MELTQNPYDHVAKSYDEISRKREKYLDSVDQIVIDLLSDYKYLKMFDFGSGNGKRAKKISDKLASDGLVLSDSSELMVKECLKIDNAKVFQVMGTDVPLFEKEFQGIIALWNVLGHIKDSKDRIKVLSLLRKNLAEGGRLIFDVNNRYNGASYGYCKCFFRFLIDSIHFNPKRGDVEYTWSVRGQEIKSSGHVFAPKEIAFEMNNAGLRVDKKFYVNYETGKVSRWFFMGQMLFSCEEK